MVVGRGSLGDLAVPAADEEAAPGALLRPSELGRVSPAHPDGDVLKHGQGQGGAVESPSAEDILVFWRPGCPFCFRLLRAMEHAGLQYELRNIWDDPDAAVFVRSVAGGCETVPTVVARTRVLVNPRLDEVVAALASEKAAS